MIDLNAIEEQSAIAAEEIFPVHPCPSRMTRRLLFRRI